MGTTMQNTAKGIIYTNCLTLLTGTNSVKYTESANAARADTKHFIFGFIFKATVDEQYISSTDLIKIPNIHSEI